MKLYSDLFHRFVHLHDISYSAGKLQFYQLWRNFCNWPVAGSQHIYPMHTYIHTLYLLICMSACSLLWSNDSRFCLVVQYNSYLLLTVYIRRSLPFVFFLSLTPLLTKGLFTQFQFLWHCMVLIYVYFVPVLAVLQCYLALTTRRMSNELCAARQDTRCTRVYASLSLGTCPVNSLPSLPQICMRPFCLSL